MQHPPHPDVLPLGVGTFEDYHMLAAHHYRGGRPGAVMRVLVIRDPRATPMQRFLKRQKVQIKQKDQVGETVAVLVESLPPLACVLRDRATGGRYGPPLSMGERAKLLNAEVRTISRVVVDPRWRGLGLAVRLVRHALATATTPLTEALAAMGRVSPFFERAGMARYERPPHPRDARLLDALASAGVRPQCFADVDAVRAEIGTRPEPQRRWLQAELLRWSSSRRVVKRGSTTPADPLRDALIHARERLLLNPVYYLAATGDALRQG